MEGRSQNSKVKSKNQGAVGSQGYLENKDQVKQQNSPTHHSPLTTHHSPKKNPPLKREDF
jgi:hypothetical protein